MLSLPLWGLAAVPKLASLSLQPAAEELEMCESFIAALLEIRLKKPNNPKANKTKPGAGLYSTGTVVHVPLALVTQMSDGMMVKMKRENRGDLRHMQGCLWVS